MTTRKRKDADPILDEHEANVESAVAEMNLDYIVCRDLGHPWQKRNARWLAADNCYEQTFRCPRCGTERTRFLSSRGANLDSKYDYADGYQVKGLGRLSGTDRDRIRLRSVLADVKPPERKGKSA